MKKILTILAFAAVTALAGCSRESAESCSMFPEYDGITIPCNIAPLNFRIDGTARIAVNVKGSAGEYAFKSRGPLFKFPAGKWKHMLETEKGGTLKVDITYRCVGRGHAGVRSLEWTVSTDSIDRFLSYRLIEPAYEVWSGIQVVERDMESFSTRLTGENRNAGNCCMNCHTSNGAGTSFMHLRGANGGTVLNREGRLVKLNTKTESTGNTVYGDISPDGRYGVFTAADIKFAIHSRIDRRMEVYDSGSDLVVLDFDNLTVTDSPAVRGTEYQETFPCFSADGRTIFFCRARHHEQPDSTKFMHYDIAAVQFDPETGRMGEKVVTVIPAGENLSFSHLKCSPDGKWLMASVASYGTFPIWHPECDNWLINLRTGAVDRMDNANSYGADTYHSWSSNSRWVVFASKRDDGVYGRPYIVHIDADGKAGKAFVLPQKDPDLYRTTMKSFNIPELFAVPEAYGTHDVAAFYNKVQTVPVEYRP